MPHPEGLGDRIGYESVIRDRCADLPRREDSVPRPLRQQDGAPFGGGHSRTPPDNLTHPFPTLQVINQPGRYRAWVRRSVPLRAGVTMNRRHLPTTLSGLAVALRGVLACLMVGVLSTAAMAVNSAPVGSAGSYSTEPEDSVTVTLSATDADGDSLTYIVATLPTKGSLSVGSTTIVAGDLPYTIAASGNTLTYTASGTAHGTDTFTFKANDGTVDSAAATVSIVVNLAPTAGTTDLTTLPNKDLAIILPATDADKDTMVFYITELPGHGRVKSGSTILTDSLVPYRASSAAVTYTPDTDYHGQDTFVFTVNDSYVTTSPITVTVEINTPPVATGQSVTLLPEGSKSITLAGVDTDKDPIQYIIASLPAHGTLSIDDAVIEEANLPKILDEGVDTVLYEVTAGYRGTDSFHFRVRDSESTSDRAVVAIAVNTPPVAIGSSAAGFSGTTITGTLAPTDADGDTLTVHVETLPETGTLKINGVTATLTGTYTTATTEPPFSFTFTPDADSTGTENFEWYASDGREESTPAQVTITDHGCPRRRRIHR